MPADFNLLENECLASAYCFGFMCHCVVRNNPLLWVALSTLNILATWWTWCMEFVSQSFWVISLLNACLLCICFSFLRGSGPQLFLRGVQQWWKRSCFRQRWGRTVLLVQGGEDHFAGCHLRAQREQHRPYPEFYAEMLEMVWACPSSSLPLLLPRGRFRSLFGGLGWRGKSSFVVML